MSIGVAIKQEDTAAGPSDRERLVDQLANRIGSLGAITAPNKTH